MAEPYREVLWYKHKLGISELTDATVGDKKTFEVFVESARRREAADLK